MAVPALFLFGVFALIVLLVFLTSESIPNLNKNVPAQYKDYFNQKCNVTTQTYNALSQVYEVDANSPGSDPSCDGPAAQLSGINEDYLFELWIVGDKKYYLPYNQNDFYGSTTFPFNGALTLDCEPLIYDTVDHKPIKRILYYDESIDGKWSI